MLMRLEGKVAIVTGAAQGQGLATAELFAAEGATVYAADIAPANEVSSDRIKPRGLDISDAAQWEAVVAEVAEAEGRLDILVNNAGITGASGPIEHTTLEDWDRVIATNLTGTFLGVRSVIPTMRASGGGSIVNVSSIVAFSPVPFVAPYHATKGGIRALTKHAARACASDGIRVNGIYPGIIDTPMMEAAAGNDQMLAAFTNAIPLGRVGRAREVANGTLFLASDEASYITGTELVIDGGASVESALAAGQQAAFAAMGL